MRYKIAILISSLVASLSMASVAHADTTTITNTGPGSNNVYTVTNTYTETVTNVTNTNISNTNVQSGTTGPASVNGNTTGGDATSGSVNNSFSSATSVNITNGTLPEGGYGAGPAETPSNIAGSTSTSGLESSVAMLPRTGGGGLSELMNALLNARTGVIGPMQKTSVEWSWVPTFLALASAVAATYVYSKYKQKSLIASF